MVLFLKTLEIVEIQKLLGFDTVTKRIYTEDLAGNIGYMQTPFMENIIINQNQWSSVMPGIQQPYVLSNDYSNSFKVITFTDGDFNGKRFVCFFIFCVLFVYNGKDLGWKL